MLEVAGNTVSNTALAMTPRVVFIDRLGEFFNTALPLDSLRACSSGWQIPVPDSMYTVETLRYPAPVADHAGVYGFASA
jgi:hypothetical protein